MDANKQKAAVATLSVASNTILVIGKIIIGIAIGSVSIISEGIHSAVDLLAALIALFAVKTSNKPADNDHPYGHGKIENISGTIEALLIFLAAGWIIFEAIKKLIHPEPVGNVGWGVAVMLLSAVLNIIVSQRLFKVGRATGSVALEADAWHLRTDVYTSAGVMVGLGLMLVGNYFFPHVNLHWLDPVAAIAVAMLILHAAWKLTVDAVADLMDVSLPDAENSWICDYVHQHRESVYGCHNLRTRRNGSVRYIEFHLLVDPGISVQESHDLTELMTADIESRFPQASVLIHVEPCDGSCEGKCVKGCLLDSTARMRRQANHSIPHLRAST